MVLDQSNKEVKLEVNLNKHPTKSPRKLIIEDRTKKKILLASVIQNWNHKVYPVRISKRINILVQGQVHPNLYLKINF